MKRVIVTVTNDLVTDNRMHKVCETLSENGYAVTLLGRKQKKSPAVHRSYLIKRFRLFWNSGFLFYAEYNIRLWWYLLFHRFDVYYAVDLDTALPHYLIAKLTNKPFVYDAHEYFPEVPEVTHRKTVKRIWQMIEKLIVPKATAVLTVSNGIARIFQEKYSVNATVLRNVPKAFDCKREKSKQPLIIYQGSVNVHRGIEYLVQAMKHLPAPVKLWIIGDGDIFQQIRKLVEDEHLQEKVELKGRIPLSELPEYTCQAWVGVSIEENVGESYRLALPNKIFDYIQARVPVLVSDLPEMRKIIEQYGVGEILPNHRPETIADCLYTMLFDEKKQREYQEALPKAREELVWENEQKILLNILSRISK